MLIIDTNTLYYVAGLSRPDSINVEKVVLEISKNGGAMVSSVSFAEFLSKYHNDAETVRQTCTFMRQHNIQICENKVIPFKDDIVERILDIKQSELDGIFDDLVILKSKVESQFATTIFFTVLVCQTIFECNINPCSLPKAIFDFFSTIIKDTLRPIVSDMFQSAYQEAYKTDDAENIIRRDFYNYLRIISSLCIPLFKNYINEFDKIPEGEIVDVPQIIARYSDTNWAEEMTAYQKKVDKQTTPSQYLKRRGLSYGKSINDKELNALLDGLQNSFFKTLGTSSLGEYMFSIVENTISNGGAFRKNDINDALILLYLQQGDVIITFDNRMIEHMEKHAEKRKEYDDSVRLIKSIIDNSEN